ncbi:MAG: hypothetical protein CFE44_21535, partial [Burkholderiales bacterium PBB4]
MDQDREEAQIGGVDGFGHCALSVWIVESKERPACVPRRSLSGGVRTVLPTAHPPRRHPVTVRFSQVAAAAAFCVGAAASAQTWPAKPVTIVVPFPAGGTTDVLARAISTKLSAAIGQPVIVDNKPGAGATLGAAQVAKANDGGHTLLMGAVHHTVATNLYKKLSYSFEKDFQPITTVALVPNVLVVSTKAPYNNVRDLLAAAKSKPDSLSYGSNGNGTAQHMIGTQFQLETGTTLLHVPYKGSAPLTTDLLGGQVNMSFDTITPVLPFIKEGKLKPL